MLPVLGIINKELEAGDLLLNIIAEELNCKKEDIVDFDLSLYDTQPAVLTGMNEEFVSCGRLDDLAMVHAGLYALLYSTTTDMTQVLAIFDNEEELTYDIVLRCYCWLGFMGVREDRVEHILSKDVDLKKLKVVVDGKDYGIYLVYNDDDVICNASTCFQKCKDMDAFRYFHPLYNEIIWRQRVDGPQLLRGIKSGPRCDRLRETLSRANAKAIKEGRTQLRLTYKRLWLCGLFYSTYLKELQGETIDFRNIAIAILENRNEKNDESRKSWIAHNTVEFKRDYISWKELYGY
jgi:hypothetical protein